MPSLSGLKPRQSLRDLRNKSRTKLTYQLPCQYQLFNSPALALRSMPATPFVCRLALLLACLLASSLASGGERPLSLREHAEYSLVRVCGQQDRLLGCGVVIATYDRGFYVLTACACGQRRTVANYSLLSPRHAGCNQSQWRCAGLRLGQPG